MFLDLLQIFYVCGRSDTSVATAYLVSAGDFADGGTWIGGRIMDVGVDGEIP